MTGGGAHVTAHLAAAAGLTSSSLTGVELWTMAIWSRSSAGSCDVSQSQLRLLLLP